jgi:hypothetical protein
MERSTTMASNLKTMVSKPKKREIDERTIKLLVGLIALLLAFLTNLFAKNPLESISASYYEGGWSQSIFIGFLFAISAFLLAYNGRLTREMVLSKVAAVASLGVALFPCDCDGHPPLVPYVHGLSAAIMFVILAYFCYLFFLRAQEKGYTQARVRAVIYVICGIVILVSIAVLAIDFFGGGILSAIVPTLTFWGEGFALVFFSISWLTASRLLPFITSKEDWDEYFDQTAVQDGTQRQLEPAVAV